MPSLFAAPLVRAFPESVLQRNFLRPEARS
jgi:hypothetical protein